jgi:large subunit ribosomal protein L21
MFAIVTIAGQQFKVEQGQEIYVHQLAASEGDKLSFDQVHLIQNGESVRIGKPTLTGAKVDATVVNHAKGDKVIIFKKKRRKGYVRKKGHRQRFTMISIDAIVG